MEQNNGDDDGNNANALCSEFLFDFLEGTTSAGDSCDGLKNAYTAAGCSDDAKSYHQNNNNDDYFVDFSSHACCAILKDHYSEYCRSAFEFSNLHLLSAMVVLLIAECAKNVIHRMKYVNFIPEAGICILVGMLGGAVAHLMPNSNIDDMSFDSDLFMSVLLPPIIFDAALSVSKTQFTMATMPTRCVPSSSSTSWRGRPVPETLVMASRMPTLQPAVPMMPNPTTRTTITTTILSTSRRTLVAPF